MMRQREKSRIGKQKQKKMVECFVVGATARSTSKIIEINMHTASLYFHKLQLPIYKNNLESVAFEGEIEVDESYFLQKAKNH